MSRRDYFGMLFVEAMKRQILENQCISYGCDDPKESDANLNMLTPQFLDHSLVQPIILHPPRYHNPDNIGCLIL